MKEHEKCGWCNKALTKKRRKVSPVGKDCEQTLPEELRVAILNITLHDGAHYIGQGSHDIAQQSIDNYFGDDVDLIIILDMHYSNEMSEATIASYYNDEGRALCVNVVCPDRCDENMDEGDKAFFGKRELELKRRIAMMIDTRTPTKVSIIHIDADWIWFLNGGQYLGPLSSKKSPLEHATEQGWNWPLETCGWCNLLEPERYHISQLEEEVGIWSDHKERWMKDGLTRAFYYAMKNQAIQICDNHKRQFEEYEMDFTKHPWFRELDTGFIGEIHQWAYECEDGIPGEEFVTIDDINDYFGETEGYRVELDSEMGQRIVEHNMIRFMLRNLTAGFDDKWKWVIGKAKWDCPHARDRWCWMTTGI